jgi:hypothetical protein
MKDDPIVKEVRQTRRDLMERFGNDPDRYWAHLKEREKEIPLQYVSVEELEKAKRAVAETPASYVTPPNEPPDSGSEKPG